jgi:phosphoadenosine phosphosulfate reductase
MVKKRKADWEVKRDEAIKILKALEPPEGYYVAFSGGKDSCVIKALCDMAKVKYDAHYAVSGIDPPQLVRFIKDKHPDVSFDRNCKPFLIEVRTKGFPVRNRAWCCEKYKHSAGKGRISVLGVRREESGNRSDREMLGYFGDKLQLNIIVNWNDGDVWEFIKKSQIAYCKLYDEGWSRLGCIACPKQSEHVKRKELERWPRFEKSYRVAFRKLYEHKMKTNPDAVKRWKNGDDMFDWWISNTPLPPQPENTLFYEPEGETVEGVTLEESDE